MITLVYQILQMSLPTETARPRLIDEISGEVGSIITEPSFVLGTEGPKEMGDDKGHETDDVDGSCFVSKSPAGDKMRWVDVQLRLEFHHMICPGLPISFCFILRPFFSRPSIALRPKTCAKSIARQGPIPSRIVRSDSVHSNPAQPDPDDHRQPPNERK